MQTNLRGTGFLFDLHSLKTSYQNRNFLPPFEWSKFQLFFFFFGSPWIFVGSQMSKRQNSERQTNQDDPKKSRTKWHLKFYAK